MVALIFHQSAEHLRKATGRQCLTCQLDVRKVCHTLCNHPLLSDSRDAPCKQQRPVEKLYMY